MEIYTVTISCPAGHTQQCVWEGYSKQWVEQWAGLVSGRSSLYVHPPHEHPDSPIGKCGLCGQALSHIVEEGRHVRQGSSPLISVSPIPYGTRIQQEPGVELPPDE